MKTTVALRNIGLNAMAPEFNNGYLRFYSGTAPATPETAATHARRAKLSYRFHEQWKTGPQYRFLREAGVDVIQGFLFSKPVPAEDFARLLGSNGFAEQIRNLEREAA